jgi:phospholipid N-methyltransferase
VGSAKVIVELGPGTGVLTGEILRRMRPDAKLVAVEINPDFVDVLRGAYFDPRLLVYQGSAEELEKALIEAKVSQADLVVSGIPFSTLAPSTRRATLEAAQRVLGLGGYFVAYQFRSHVRRFADPVFGPGAMQHELWNIPPMRVYVWQRKPPTA